MIFFFLFFVAALGSGLNSVAGGGSFIVLPSLLYAGVPPVTANATTTLAMWPGLVSSTVGYRREVATLGKWVWLLGAIGVAGGLGGAMLLLRTSDTTFVRLLPWLMLVAVVTFTFGPQRLSKRGRESFSGSAWAANDSRPLFGIVLVQIAISIYGGYFGGGMGFMMLATFTLAGMNDIHVMNGLKVILSVAINGAALAEFIIRRAIDWQHGIVMVAGASVGGYLGASMARRIDGRWVRMLVLAIGWTMTIYFFVR
jgi:hypothetical protein